MVAFNGFNRTFATNATPTAASGAVSFTVANVAKLPTAVPYTAKVIPQQSSRFDPYDDDVTGAQQITITNISGSTVTATLGANGTTAQAIKATYYIIADGVLSSVVPFTIASVAPASTLYISANNLQLTSSPNATSDQVVTFSVVLISNPVANNPAAANALMAFVYHQSGNFTQVILRAIGGSAVQNAAGTIDEARGLEGFVSVSAGTVSIGVGVDSSWAQSAGTMTSWVAFRNRQGNAGGAPVTEYLLIGYGYSQMEKGLTIGAFSSVTNASLNILQGLNPSGGVALGINLANTFIATANSDAFYGINIGQAITKGAFTGLVYYGISLTAPTASGAGTVATAAQIYLELPSIATNNYYMRIADTLDATALGAYQGRYKVLTSAGTGYVPVYAA